MAEASLSSGEISHQPTASKFTFRPGKGSRTQHLHTLNTCNYATAHHIVTLRPGEWPQASEWLPSGMKVLKIIKHSIRNPDC